jgi:hypothetical protein
MSDHIEPQNWRRLYAACKARGYHLAERKPGRYTIKDRGREGIKDATFVEAAKFLAKQPVTERGF